jgi:restriction endonuclease Mrr
MSLPYTFSGHDFEAAFDLSGTDGRPSIIEVVSFIDESLVRRLHENPKELQNIDRRVFEELIAELFFDRGYQVELTRKTKDGGVDVVAIKHRDFAERYLIQCKRPEPRNSIGVEVVHQLYGVQSANKSTKAIIATTTRLTRGAKQFIEENKWHLDSMEYDDIHDWIRQYVANRSTSPR